MSLLSDIGKSMVKTFTSPVRFLGNVAEMGINAAKVVGSAITLNPEGVKKNLGELAKSTKDAAFSGVETGFLLAGGAAAMGAKATVGAAAASVGGHVATTSAVKTGAEHAGTAFVEKYAETQVRA